MQKILTFSLCLLACSISWSQEEVRKFHYGLTVMPQLNVSTFGDGELTKNKSSINYYLSGDLYYDQSSRLQLRTGVAVQGISLRHRDYSAQWPSDVHNGDWVPYQSWFELRSDYVMIGIPLEVKLNINDKPNQLFVTGGLQLKTVLASGGRVTSVVSGQIEDLDYMDTFLFEPTDYLSTVTIGFGYQRSFGKSKVSLSPTFEYSMNKFFKTESSAVANGHLALLGLRLSWYL